jgi:hypothetical protein
MENRKEHMSAHSLDDRRKPLDVDSTQRMRALTATELYDSHRPKSYAVQLVVSDKPVNLDMMPRLEAFAAHRLYTIAAKQPGGTWYALRLGFFPDEESAQVICGYLETFFSSPSIVRVSTAELERFAPSASRASAATPRASAATPAPAPAVPRQVTMQSPTIATAPPKQSTKTKAPRNSTSSRPKTLGEELVEEARELQRSRSGRNRAPEQSGSWVTRLFGGAKPRPRST